MNHILLALLLGATAVHAGIAHAGSMGSDQAVLGNLLLVKNPSTLDKRKVTVKAKETASPNTIVGDPTVSGGNAFVRADGTSPSFQIYALPQGTSSAGKPFWSGDATKGFKYKDPKGDNGPVKSAQIKKSGGGVLTIKILVNGKNGLVDVVPPDPGDGGCAILQLVGGDNYNVLFQPGDGQVTNKGATLFKYTKPTIEGVCFPPSTTTTTSTSSSTSISTSTSTSVTTSTSTTSTTATTIYAGPAFPPVGGDVDFSFSGNAQGAGGADVSLFDFDPTTWTALYWGPFNNTFPAAGLDGSNHIMGTFLGITGGGTIATWEGTTPWTNPGDMMVYIVPIRFTLTIVSGAVTFEPSTGVPDLDPGPGTGIDVVIDVAPAGTAIDFTTNWAFSADIPTDGPGFIPLADVPQTGGGLTLSSFGGGFYSQM
jgi:hypothetical protein